MFLITLRHSRPRIACNYFPVFGLFYLNLPRFLSLCQRNSHPVETFEIWFFFEWYEGRVLITQVLYLIASLITVRIIVLNIATLLSLSPLQDISLFTLDCLCVKIVGQVNSLIALDFIINSFYFVVFQGGRCEYVKSFVIKPDCL